MSNTHVTTSPTARGRVRAMRYYDLQANWRKVKRHIDHPEVQAVLVGDLSHW